ncbi:SH3 domain-containing protein [soil metagenome]
MIDRAAGRRRFGPVLLGIACLTVVALATWSLMAGKNTNAQSAGAPRADITSSTAPPEKSKTATGLPLPRFVSLKSDKINVRRGPSSDHPVAWVFQRKGLPVEIIAEFENWRRIRDSDGAEGWVYQSMLSGKRTAIVAPWRKTATVAMLNGPDSADGIVARVKAGVVGTISQCSGKWCNISAGGYSGWVEQPMLWGVYPDEEVSD